MDNSEILTKLFLKLNSNNKSYALAILHTLISAQDTLETSQNYNKDNWTKNMIAINGNK